MRILNSDFDTAIKNVILYLKPEEAKELYDSLGVLLKNNNFSEHIHINDVDFEHEVTMLLYDEKQMDSLNERSKKIIIEDL